MEVLPDKAKGEVGYVTRLGANVVAYATGRELKNKLDRPKAIDLADVGLRKRPGATDPR